MSAAEKHGIKKISDYQHLRLRTEMYLGSRSNHSQYVPIHTNAGTTVEYLTWVPAIMTSFREIIDNSLDEFTKANIAGILDVKYLESDLLFEVSDNGRGIPIDWDSTHNCHLATLVMSELKAGRNFDDSERKGVSGMNGLGGSAVVNISSEFEVEVYRKGSPKFNNAVIPGKYHFKQRFFEGNPEFDDSLQVCEPELKTTSSSSSGTTARFQLSNHVFKHRTLPTVLVESLLREIAAVNPRHKITFNGKRLPSGTVESTLFKKKTISLHINETGFLSTFYVVPNIVAPENGVVLHSLVNNIPTYKSGNHLDTFKTHFALRLIKALEKESKRRKLKPNRSDIEEGLLIYNNTVMDCPFFGSQAKDQLINEEVIKLVDKAISEEWLLDVVRTNKGWIDEIFARCAERTSAKDADEVDKEARKNLRKKVAKLRDASGKRGNTYLNRAECILFISEGDSSIGSLMDVRDPAIHGALPLRGKILNVSDGKITAKKVLDSQATSDIMNALGLIPGQKAVRGQLRYGHLCIACDADEDGKDIFSLVINFLYNYWPELFDDKDDPFVRIFLTPYIILEKAKTNSAYYYQDNYHDFDPQNWKGWNIRRAKGLGTLTKRDWNHCINIEQRFVPIINDDNLKETLDMLFNKDRADDRKVWLQGEQWLK